MEGLNSFSVEDALAVFVEARSLMVDTFDRSGASAIVGAVLKGSMPRRGKCLNGYEYFVHGVGYTVVFPDGGQVHIDGNSLGEDVFSVFDLALFLDTSGSGGVLDRKFLESELGALVSAGRLQVTQGKKYVVPGS